MSLCLLNVRSVRNKALTVKNFTVDRALDTLLITETWQKPGNGIGTFCPTGYLFLLVPRHDSITFGGSIGFLFKENLDVHTSVSEEIETFELMDTRLKNIECARILCTVTALQTIAP